MKISILRTQTNTYQEYELEEKEQTLLNALSTIKSTQDQSLTFSAGCRASVCGTCGVRVNQREVLACAYKVKDGDVIEPLNYHTILRDLKVEKSNALKTLNSTNSWLHRFKEASLNHNDEKLTEKQTDCILCSLCYSVCPVYAVNPNFLGAFALTRAYRYSLDKRENETKTIIDTIQNNGIWDCTLCGECTSVCPKGIDSKMDITMLRGKSIEFGHNDPSFMTQSFGTPNFGFDPNSF